MDNRIQALASFIDLLGASITGIITLGLLVIIINVIIVLALLKYAAKKNAEMFDYDKLAKKIAEQIMVKQIEYDNFKQREIIKAEKYANKNTKTDENN